MDAIQATYRGRLSGRRKDNSKQAVKRSYKVEYVLTTTLFADPRLTTRSYFSFDTPPENTLRFF